MSIPKLALRIRRRAGSSRWHWFGFYGYRYVYLGPVDRLTPADAMNALYAITHRIVG